MDKDYDQARPWWSQSKDLIRFSQCKPPFETVFVGSDLRDGVSLKTIRSFAAIVNVSDSTSRSVEEFPYGLRNIRQHWVPINEIGAWGYMPFYQFKQIMDYHYERNEPVYVHCHAGAFRAPIMTMCWIMSRGIRIRQASWLVRPREYSAMPEKYKAAVNRGVIPPGLKRFYSSMRRHPQWGFMGHALSKWHGKSIEESCTEFRAKERSKKLHLKTRRYKKLF